MLERSDVIIMVARQRSGTNALRDVLESHPEIFCTPEVFHVRPSPEAHLEVDLNFFRFLQRHPDGTVERSMSVETQERIFLDFLDFLRSATDKRYVLVDVKYNSTHHLDGPWRAVSAPPSLFEFMQAHGTRTLNLTRRNYLRWYLSWQKAQRTHQWTSRATTGSDDPAIRIDVRDLMWNVNACGLEDDMVARALRRKGLYKSFDYVDLFPAAGEGVSPEVLGYIAEWLGIEPAFEHTRPQYEKLSVLGLQETIENYDEVAAAMAGTPYEYCLEDEPLYRAAAGGATR